MTLRVTDYLSDCTFHSRTPQIAQPTLSSGSTGLEFRSHYTSSVVHKYQSLNSDLPIARYVIAVPSAPAYDNQNYRFESVQMSSSLTPISDRHLRIETRCMSCVFQLYAFYKSSLLHGMSNVLISLLFWIFILALNHLWDEGYLFTPLSISVCYTQIAADFLSDWPERLITCLVSNPWKRMSLDT